MLRFTLLGFPVVIHWVFWVTMAMLGGAFSANTPEAMQRVLAWVAAGFVSIMIHELGHALAMRRFGARQVHIVLHGFGGCAAPDRRFGRLHDFLISGAGPALQIIAGIAAWLLMKNWQPEAALGRYFLGSFFIVSLYWAILNLFPIIPLDGGHLMRAILGPQRLRIALIISLVCAVGFGILALSNQALFIAIFFGFFAYNNWKQLRGEPVSMVP